MGNGVVKMGQRVNRMNSKMEGILGQRIEKRK